ncbi:MAG: glycoside hydrolase family 99-like domain-containing protein [Hydrogenophaga sp.]|nr:glycoside hydrolase family 99-like domain-containing protein [Hydrogenophaga sp.]
MNDASEPVNNEVKLIAFFLPQFHPTRENDLWWGKGFTEWTNVTKSKPLFSGHYQPHLPTDLGFYDLRLKETRLEQIALAKQYGLHGFCYHYYWFSGTRILNQPVDAMLADRDHDMPFCLCWANENWTRQWDAAEHEILIAQKYAPTDDLDFIKSIVPFFKDERYIRQDGKPILIVYRPQHLPDSFKSIEIWRNHCREVGIGEIHVCCALSHGNLSHTAYGFDSGVEFPPHNLEGISGLVPKQDLQVSSGFEGTVVQYEAIAGLFLNRSYRDPNIYRCVFPSWDNTARRGRRAFVVLNGTPENYEYWLNETIKKTRSEHPGEQRFVFINAWNEWAEGCHLEPDRVYGRKFLEATQRAISGASCIDSIRHDSLPQQQEQFFLHRLMGESGLDWAANVSTDALTEHLPYISCHVSIQRPQSIAIAGMRWPDLPPTIARALEKAGSKDYKIWASFNQGGEDLSASLPEEVAAHFSMVSADVTAFLSSLEDQACDLVIINCSELTQPLQNILALARKKLTHSGVIMLHGVSVESNVASTHWRDLKSEFPSYTFLNSAGLGVLLAGDSVDPFFLELNDADTANERWALTESFFKIMGSRLSAMSREHSIANTVAMQHHMMHKLEERIQDELQVLKSTLSWRITKPLRWIRKKLTKSQK